MTNTICLDEKYSTTKLVTKEKPEIVNNPDDKFESVLFLPEGEERKGESGLRTKGYFKKSYEDKPLISIVTVVFNGEHFLEETIQSVLNQTYDNVEYIIIDGGSTDGTVDIIKKYEDKLDYWVSERDSGIYDAMNKGIKQASGEIIGLINADDYYTKDTLQIVKKEFEKDIDILYSDFNFLDEDKIIRKKANHKLLSITMSVFHPSVFIRKCIYKKYGYFDSSLKISADYKLLYKLHKNSLKFKKVDTLLAVMRVGGVSTNSSVAIDETFEIQREESIFTAYIFKFLRVLKRKIL